MTAEPQVRASRGTKVTELFASGGGFVRLTLATETETKMSF